MSLVQKIKEGIETKDWAIICGVYESLTGENLPIEEEIDELEALRVQLDAIATKRTAAKTTKKTQTKKNVVKSIKKNEKTDSKHATVIFEDISQISKSLLKKELAASGRGEVKGRQPIFFTGGEDTKDKAFSAKVAKSKRLDRQDRDPAEEHEIRKCTTCGNEFDFTKAYPAGKIGDSFECLCNNCIVNRR